MLISCLECKREISDQAESCPHCGHPLKRPAAAEPAAPQTKQGSAPIFLVLGAIALVLALGTPRFLLFFPLIGTIGFAAISLFRRERARSAGVLVLVCGIGLWVLNESPSTGSNTSAETASRTLTLSSVEISDWNWRKDPNFGTRGTIKWNVSVKNKGPENLRNVKVEFTTYDGAGKMVSTTFTYVSAIPPGETRSESSYADFYGTEARAATRISEVHPAR